MDKPQEIIETSPNYRKKTLQAIRFVEAGIPAKEALKAANLTDKISDQAVAKFKEKFRKYTLTSDSTVSLAHRQIKRILRGKAREAAQEKINKAGEVVKIIEQIVPTDSNILAAAQMVYDRYEPVRGQEQGVGSGNTYIDLSTYTNTSISVQPVDNSVDIAPYQPNNESEPV